MRAQGYGANYQYAHEHQDHVAPDQVHLPETLAGSRYYEPGPLGREADLASGNAQRRERGGAGTEPS